MRKEKWDISRQRKKGRASMPAFTGREGGKKEIPAEEIRLRGKEGDSVHQMLVQDTD